jgi:hypothetical protein
MANTDKKISQLTQTNNLGASDLIPIVRDDGEGGFDNYVIPAQVIITISININLTANIPYTITHNLNTFPVFLTAWGSDGEGNIIEINLIKQKNTADALNKIDIISNADLTGVNIKIKG